MIAAIIRPRVHHSRIRRQVLSARRIHVRLAEGTHDHTGTITGIVIVITDPTVIRIESIGGRDDIIWPNQEWKVVLRSRS